MFLFRTAFKLGANTFLVAVAPRPPRVRSRAGVSRDIPLDMLLRGVVVVVVLAVAAGWAAVDALLAGIVNCRSALPLAKCGHRSRL